MNGGSCSFQPYSWSRVMPERKKVRHREIRLEGKSPQEKLIADTKCGYLWLGGDGVFIATLTKLRDIRQLHAQLGDLIRRKGAA